MTAPLTVALSIRPLPRNRHRQLSHHAQDTQDAGYRLVAKLTAEHDQWPKGLRIDRATFEPSDPAPEADGESYPAAFSMLAGLVDAGFVRSCPPVEFLPPVVGEPGMRLTLYPEAA